MKEKIAIIGSTGSIGRQTLEVVDQYPELYGVSVLSAGGNVDLLIEQSLKYGVSQAIIADESKYEALKRGLWGSGIEAACGSEAIRESMGRGDFGTLVSATVGYSGLEPTVEAIRHGKRIALANKETLVVAGELIETLLEQSPSKIVPIDSEHSAIYQCVAGEDVENVSKLWITASGGPFLHLSSDEMANVSVAQALNHPKWKMGRKITIDSATMMNKAFEIIEARWLFGIEGGRISAVVHPQSIVHSMVEFRDGSVKAQLATPDMRLPISYALSDGKRRELSGRGLTVGDLSHLTFEEPDTERFPCLKLAHYALKEGGTRACTINAANEIAVEAFLNGRIAFTEIYEIIETTLQKTQNTRATTVDDYIRSNEESRKKAAEAVESIGKRKLRRN